MNSKKPAGWLVDLSLVAVALIWGATFVLVKRALADVSTLLFLTLRFTIAAAALALLFHRELRGANLARNLRGGMLAGLCLFC
ncbi:MAG: EamA family transporter, partial [Bryobacteraceae bacterium]